MTIRVTIEVPVDEQYAVCVSRESSHTGEVLRYVQPGERFETYFWKDNKLVLTEVAKLPAPIITASQPKQLLQEVPVTNTNQPTIDDTITDILNSKESIPGFEGHDDFVRAKK